jgi:hypothetical protein
LGRAIKVTHPNRYGHSIARETGATPVEYLMRLAYQNKFFGDNIRILGGIVTDGALEIVTAQPWINAGYPTVPTQEQIDAYLANLGFFRSSLFPDGFYYFSPATGCALADAQPNNVLIARDNRLVPIDIVIGRPDAGLRSRLAAEFEPLNS